MRRSKTRPRVVIGFLGTTLDEGRAEKRWARWRPSVALCQHEDFPVARLELIHQPSATGLADFVRADIQAVSPETSVTSHAIALKNPWDFDEVVVALHAFARSYPFKPDDEDYFVHISTGTHIVQICLFLLTESRHFPGKLLQSSPGHEGSEKTPQGTLSIIDLDLSSYTSLAPSFRAEKAESVTFLKSGIATRNARFNKLIEKMETVSQRSKDPMLLMGPTGSGKSQLAKRIYALKKARRQVEGELVEVNCATLRGDGAMSMLFGHIKGAYTGALNDRTGMLKKADKGLLFLDEIGELGLDEQAMLLRAIEEKSFFPVGSDREVKSHFQLLAGTNRDLALDVKKGLFRDDLLARIHLWSFVLPALRERPEDIEPNLEYELEQCTQTMGRKVSFTRDARVRFLRFAQSSEGLWPGNFRDFGASIRRMATLAHQGSIEALDVDEELERLRLMWRSEHAQGGQSLAAALLGERIEAIDRFDLVQLEEVLRVCRTSSSLSAAGRVLFAASRATKTSQNDADRLRKYLARFQLSWAEVRGTS